MTPILKYDALYWVEATRAVRDYNRVIGYGVWCITEESGRTRVHNFSVTRNGGWQVALHLANTLRDDLNAGIE